MPTPPAEEMIPPIRKQKHIMQKSADFISSSVNLSGWPARELHSRAGIVLIVPLVWGDRQREQFSRHDLLDLGLPLTGPD